MLETILTFQTDLAQGLKCTRLRQALMTMDDQAHTFAIAVTRDGAEQALDGATVSAYFVRADGVTVPITGSAEGNVARVTLTASCYRVEGRAQLVVKATLGGVVSSIFWADGAVSASQTDAIVSNEDVIPSLDELLAQIATIEEATSAANAAATAASSAAHAAENWGNATATIAMLGAGSPPSVALTDTGNGKALAFGIPMNPVPQLEMGTVTTGAPGSNASASLTGTDDRPVLNLTIPQGATGRIENLTVNGTPVENGNLTIDAETAGAIPKTAAASTVQDILNLAYPVGSVYMSMSDTSPATLFGGLWVAIEGRFLLAAGGEYAAGESGGAATHALTQAELPDISLDVPGEPATSSPAWAEPNQAVVYRYMAGTPQGAVSIPLGGSGQAFSTMPPYLVVHMWYRTA